MAHHFMFSCALIAMLCLCADAAHAGSWAQNSVINAAGSRTYRLWIPDGYNTKTPVPLVLMLHGCTQTPDDFASGTRMNAVADKHHFLVVYPEQPASANPYKCWNWFDPAHQSRGVGEPSLLAAVVDNVRSTHKVDKLRIYVAGVSAGGAMATIMAAAYPEMFAAIAVCAGIEYKAALNVAGALAAQKSGGPDPDTQGLQAYQAMTAASVKTEQRALASRTHRRPIRVIVFHGTLDTVVRPINGDQTIAQWARTNDLLDDARDNNTVDATADSIAPGSVPNGYHFTRYVYNDATGKPLLEKWIVQDIGHAWSGGSTDGSYTAPKGPNASEEIWRFFRQTPPTPHIRSRGRSRQQLQ